ncbi:hypothetical protein ACO0LC_21375 [Undibacterium sp. JH2W]
MSKEHLQFFKDLIEGKAQVSFLGYFPRHEESIKESLDRASFLRLKFEPFEEIEKILGSSGVTYFRDEAAIRQEKYFFNFHKDVLDENGKLLASHKRSLFNNSIGHYLNGALEEARLSLSKYLGLTDNGKKKYSYAKFQDVVSFADIEIDCGDKALGQFILALIASLPRSYSVIDDLSIYARQKLQIFE